MVRRLCLTLAVLAGLCAALLVGMSVSARADGRSTTCGSVIGVAAVAPQPDDRPDVERACHSALVRTTMLAGIAALVCIGCGTAVAFGGPERGSGRGSGRGRVLLEPVPGPPLRGL